jgi:hypothetical protein
MTYKSPNHNELNKHILTEIGLASCSKNQGQKKYIINWPDLSIRWIFSIRNLRAGYLSFQENFSLRQRLINIMVCVLSILPVKIFNLVSARNFIIQKSSVLGRVMSYYNADDWDFFAGSPGINRNIVVAIYKNENIVGYLKKPLYHRHKAQYSKLSDKFLTEADGYKYINSLKLGRIITPRVKVFDDAIFMSPMEGRGLNRKDHQKIVTSLNEIRNTTSNFFSIQEYIERKNLLNKIDILSTSSPIDSSFGLSCLNKIISSVSSRILDLPKTHEINCSFALVDFTSWNNFLIEDKIGLIDIEFCEKNITLGYDLAHFYIQDYLMSTSRPTHIRLQNIIVKNILPSLVSDFGISTSDAKLYVDLYLIQKVIDSLSSYAKQDKLHQQAKVQLKFWEDINMLWVGEF